MPSIPSPPRLLSIALVACAWSATVATPSRAQSPEAVLGLIREADLAALCQQLVRVRSDYDEGVVANHREMAQVLAGRLRDLGFQTQVAGPNPDYPTVVGRLRGSGGGPVLGLLAHYNTVTAGDLSKWTVDPFGGELKDGRIYGLGAADQKMAIASALTAVRAVIESRVPRRGDLVLLFIPGEGAQVHSLPFIVRDQPDLLKADWYLDTEGGQNITKIAGGWTWVRVTVQGTTGHTGATEYGKARRPINAIYRLARVLTRLEDVDAWMTYEKHPSFANPAYEGKPVVEVGKIEGGHKVNQVPDRAEAQIDVRLLPGQSPDRALTEMRALFARMIAEDPDLDVRVEPMTTQWVPMRYWDSLTDDDPLVRAIREIAPAVLGRTPGWSGSIGGGRPDLWATGAKWVSFGISDGGNVHAPNEYATIAGGMKRTELFTRLILRMIGG